MKKSDNSSDPNNSSYYVLQNWYHRCSPKGGLELADNGDQSRFLNPLNLIEKAINFLRRRFDRFKHKNTFDELSELIKILISYDNSSNVFLCLGFLKAKDWILSTFDMLYEYFQELFSALQEVYEFVITIPEIVAGFFEDIVNKLVGGATDWIDDIGDFLPFY
jgi:hypothetical protein